MADADGDAAAAVNMNVGVLGHVDSGKTHLVRVLSTHLSTAALDKHPQSQQRGMTLDLGFSAFRVPSSTTSSTSSAAAADVQVTLVDCPGHASLFKTILGGVHIIDCVLLVVDVLKGLQPQTIECLLLAQLAVDARIVVAVNKIDLVPPEERDARVAQVAHDVRTFLARHFKLTRPVPVVAVAAAPASTSSTPASAAVGIPELVDAIRAALPAPTRDGSGPLCFAVDHCFAIQGNGTILTGTVLSGSVRVGDEIELPALQAAKKVKSMQMFRRSVARATQGDRVALRVNGLDASLVERGVVVAPRSLPFVSQVVVRVTQVPLFRAPCKSGAKIHATVGHTTVVAVATFFKAGDAASATKEFDPATVYRAVSVVESIAESHEDTETSSESAAAFEGFALLQFEQPAICPPKAIVVCSRFDLDPKKFHCRLAFHGPIEAIVWDDHTESDGSGYSHTHAVAPHALKLSELKVGNVKERAGVVDKPVQKSGSTPVTEVQARDMFAKDVDWQVYTDTTVLFQQSKVLGKILGPFGKSGKFRIELLNVSGGRQAIPTPGEKVLLRFIKLTTLRPLKRASGKKTAPAATSLASGKKEARKLLQDDRVLYSEAFAVPPASPRTETPEQAATPPPPPLPAQTVELPSSEPRARGRIERLKGETTADGRNPFVIVTGLFSDESSASAARGQRVRCLLSQQPGTIEEGEIEKPFGKAGKVRVMFSHLGGTLGQVGDVIELL